MSYYFPLVLTIELRLCATGPIVVRRPVRPTGLIVLFQLNTVYCQLCAVQSTFVSARALYVCIPLSLNKSYFNSRVSR